MRKAKQYARDVFVRLMDYQWNDKDGNWRPQSEDKALGHAPSALELRYNVKGPRPKKCEWKNIHEEYKISVALRTLINQGAKVNKKFTMILDITYMKSGLRTAVRMEYLSKRGYFFVVED